MSKANTNIESNAESLKNNFIATYEKNIQVNEAYAQMNQNIYNKVPEFFDTTDRESASTWSSSWQTKALNPQKYVNDQLIVIHTSSSFQTPGESLTVMQTAPNESLVDESATQAKIQQYYQELVDERLIPFDRFRDNEVKVFIATKAAILAG